MADLACPNCQKTIRVPEVAPGTGVKCPHCQGVFVYSGSVPSPSDAVPEPVLGSRVGSSVNEPLPVEPPAVTLQSRASLATTAPRRSSVVGGTNPEKVTLQCPQCHKALRVAGVSPGVGVQCPYCRAVFTYQPADEPPSQMADPAALVSKPAGLVSPRVSVSQTPVPVTPVLVTPAPVAPGVSKVSTPDESSLAKAAAVMSGGRATMRGTATMTARRKANDNAGVVIAGGVVVLVVAAIVLTIQLTRTPVISNAAKDDRRADRNPPPPVANPEPVVGPPAVPGANPAMPGAAVGKAATAGYRPEGRNLPPNPSSELLDPAIIFEDVHLEAAEFDEVTGGNPNSALIRGAIRYTGDLQALPEVQLIAYRYLPAPGGGWERQRASETLRLPAVPARTRVDFRLRTKYKKAEMEIFSIVAHNPLLSAGHADKTRFVALKLDVNDIHPQTVGDTGIAFEGHINYDGAKPLVSFQVVMDIYDQRGEYATTVVKEEVWDGASAPWQPGTRLEFTATTRRFDVRIGGVSRIDARAVGRVR